MKMEVDMRAGFYAQVLTYAPSEARRQIDIAFICIRVVHGCIHSHMPPWRLPFFSPD